MIIFVRDYIFYIFVIRHNFVSAYIFYIFSPHIKNRITN